MKVEKTLKAVIKYIAQPSYRFGINSYLGFYNNTTDEEYLKKLFFYKMDQKLNLTNPKSFNEKLQWLKLYDHRPEYTIMVDKYEVRKYISEQLGEEYLIPLLGAWDSPDAIEFEKLPEQFVLKCNHNSGLGMCICKDKSKLNYCKVRKELKKGLKQDYYLTSREWPYKDVKRKIICEKFLENKNGGEILDYKIHNFNGEPKMILVCSKRFSKEGLHEDFFDTDWNKLYLGRPNCFRTKEKIDKPKELEKMLSFSKKLSQGYPFMRTDFYEVDGKLYFGEITFYPASGLEKFAPEKWDNILGEWIKLPK